MKVDVLLISTLHTSSGSFQLTILSDGTGTAEIFGETVQLKRNGNKIDISGKFNARDFKRGAEERDEIVSWLKEEMKL
tara:strand:+ start:229 stop:462 length:234 start_codon:yes stop_codon:yes gene_type:complete